MFISFWQYAKPEQAAMAKMHLDGKNMFQGCW
jgi:hypothetical protein